MSELEAKVGRASEILPNPPGGEELQLHVNLYPRGHGKLETLVIQFEGVRDVARVFLVDGVPSIRWETPEVPGWRIR